MEFLSFEISISRPLRSHDPSTQLGFSLPLVGAAAGPLRLLGHGGAVDGELMVDMGRFSQAETETVMVNSTWRHVVHADEHYSKIK